MSIYFLIIGVTLVLYFLFWRLYLLIAPHVFSETLPDYLKKPKFWQFFLLVFALGTLRQKLDI